MRRRVDIPLVAIPLVATALVATALEVKVRVAEAEAEAVVVLVKVEVGMKEEVLAATTTTVETTSTDIQSTTRVTNTIQGVSSCPSPLAVPQATWLQATSTIPTPPAAPSTTRKCLLFVVPAVLLLPVLLPAPLAPRHVFPLAATAARSRTAADSSPSRRRT